MRAVVDINILISALMVENSVPGRILVQWRRGNFELLTCAEHIEELRRATRYPKVRARIAPAMAGMLVNEIGRVAVALKRLPSVDRSTDPSDNYLLALAETGKAEYLVTGDKADLLTLEKHLGTRIVTARQFADLLGI